MGQFVKDLFGPRGQADLFGAPEAVDYLPKPDEVRARLHAMLAEMRAADALPWDRKRTLLNAKIFPQMTNWLPEEEAAQLCLEFEAELARLEAA
jgi:hypothetical protein